MYDVFIQGALSLEDNSTILSVLTFPNIAWRKDSSPNVYIHSRELLPPSRVKNGFGGSVLNSTPVNTTNTA